MNAADMLRLWATGGTLRYHTGQGWLLKPQDVAQHVYGVQFLCWAICRGAPSAELLLAALSHDSGESYTGDLPGDIKRQLGLGLQFERLEVSFLAGLGFAREGLSSLDAAVLKLADMLEGCTYCLREHNFGNRTSEFTNVFKNFVTYAAEAYTDGTYGHPQFDNALVVDLLQKFQRSLDEHESK